ncbi:hypothetical protein [uncultured Jatrophihabitans sp.]|uniref:hypothetical protein n=1 Tax=uncultured Jatrophihabitans sp. TaxID=1610747 RepID=UPI0035CAD25C
MENTFNTTVASRPSAWTCSAVATFVDMPAATKNRLVNYIRSTKATQGSLRPDHGAAKQAAPPRGDCC